MKSLRFLFFSLIIIVAVSWFSNPASRRTTWLATMPNKRSGYKLTVKAAKKLEQIANAAKMFVKQNRYNENISFLIDMSLPSGQNRFFIYDLQKDTIRASGLVAHGNCFQNWLEGRKYSNTVGCGCTSLGKYKIGYSYTGKFGYSYKLYGLDSTNNNAFERTVVLHAHSCVPGSEVTDEICQSNGCPMVSPDFLAQLKTIINHSKKPVLFWIYE